MSDDEELGLLSGDGGVGGDDVPQEEKQQDCDEQQQQQQQQQTSATGEDEDGSNNNNNDQEMADRFFEDDEQEGEGGEGRKRGKLDTAEEAIQLGLSKKEAKKRLRTKVEYERFKKQTGAEDGEGGDVGGGKKHKKDKHKKDKKKARRDEKRTHKHKKHGKDKKKDKKQKKKRRGGGSDDDDDDDDDASEGSDFGDDSDFQDAAAAFMKERNRKGGAGGGGGGGGGVQRTSAKQDAADKKKSKQGPTEEEKRAEAEQLIQTMKQARFDDNEARRKGAPPLARLSIRNLVQQKARQSYLHQFLVEAGLLSELESWLADSTGVSTSATSAAGGGGGGGDVKADAQLAPVDLRVVALGILDNLAMDGLPGVGMPPPKEGLPKKDKETGEPIEDLRAYKGIKPLDLKKSQIGWAVNFVRRHAHESAENRTIATRLIERFGRCFRGGDEEIQDAAKVKKMWSKQGDAAVLPPFEQLPSVTMRYSEASGKADPNDPISYLRRSRPFTKPSFITNFDGNSAEGVKSGFVPPKPEKAAPKKKK